MSFLDKLKGMFGRSKNKATDAADDTKKAAVDTTDKGDATKA